MPIEVETYDELEEFIDMFREQAIDLLVVKGPGGTGKTYATKQKMDEVRSLYINTHVTPLEAFKKLYIYRDSPIIVDDIRNLISNSKLLSLFKQTGETTDEKHLQWNSTTNKLDREEFDDSFDTRSNLMIITNSLKTNGDLGKEAFIDRGFCVHFSPVKDEVLAKMEEILDKSEVKDKKEVHEFIKENYDIAENVNLRTLVKGLQLKEYGADWKDILERDMDINDKYKEVVRLHEKYEKVKNMVEEYEHSESDFYRRKNELKERGVELG